MNTNTPYKIFVRFLTASLIAFSLPLAAAEPQQLQLAYVDQDSFQGTQYKFEDIRLRGFERREMTKNLKARGWQVAKNIYLGQAKVAKKWGLGLVYERGNTVYGISNRGIQVMKRF